MNSADLVARLRAHRQAFGIHYEPREVDVCIEAADRLEALEAWKAEAMEVLRPIAAQVTNEPDTLIISTRHKMFRSARRLVEKEDGRG